MLRGESVKGTRLGVLEPYHHGWLEGGLWVGVALSMLLDPRHTVMLLAITPV